MGNDEGIRVHRTSYFHPKIRFVKRDENISSCYKLSLLESICPVNTVAVD